MILALAQGHALVNTVDPANARFFRFTVLRVINANGWTSAAKSSVSPASGSGD
jgi:hypothetical protein